jgi:demethylmenaquinone methyltransferase/2-methoxy-6-polyprenyl-1,4-benzoquinol methylase
VQAFGCAPFRRAQPSLTGLVLDEPARLRLTNIDLERRFDRMTTTKNGDQVREMFSDIAPRYDLLNHVLSLNIDRRWRRRVVRELAISPSDRILDVCTGTADLALELVQHVRSEAGGGVVGSDFCAEMVAIGERKRQERGESRLSLLVADTLDLPFPSASFDAVTVAFGIRNVVDLDAGLAEMARVLRPGGRMAILEFTASQNRWVRGAYRLYFHRVLPRIGAWISRHPTGARAYRYLPESVDRFPGPAELARRMEAAGIDGVRCLPLTFGVAAIHIGRRSAAPEPSILVGAEPDPRPSS